MLRAELRDVGHVSEREKSRLLSLMQAHYAGISESRFRSDFDAKSGVILLRDVSGALRGFSTYQIFDRNEEGRRLRILYSGDTVIECEHWGGLALFKGFGAVMNRLMGDPETVPYWFLTSKGHRTYRMLSLFFREFYPRHHLETPGWAHRLIASLGVERYGTSFDGATGVVNHKGQSDHLREDLAGVSRRLALDPHVRFFFQANPGYAEGDELACIARLTLDNVQPRARRFVVGQ